MLGSVDLSNVPKIFQWYPVVTKFNYEEKYIENVQETVCGTKLEPLISEYYIPIKYTKEKVKLIDGSEKEKLHKVKGIFSNYVFVKCILLEEVWNMLRSATGAAVVLSTGGIPVSLTDEEMDNIKQKQCAEGFSKEDLVEFNKKHLDKYFRFDDTKVSPEIVISNFYKKGENENV